MTSLAAIVFISLLVGLAAMAGLAARRGLDGQIATRQPLVLVLAATGADGARATPDVRRRALEVLRRLAGRELLGENIVVADGAFDDQRLVGLHAVGGRGERALRRQLMLELLHGDGPAGGWRLRPHAEELADARAAAEEAGHDEEAELWWRLLGCGIIDIEVPKVVAPAWLRPRGSREARTARAAGHRDRIIVAGWIDRVGLLRPEFAVGRKPGSPAGRRPGGWRELADHVMATAPEGLPEDRRSAPDYLMAWVRLRADLAEPEPREAAHGEASAAIRAHVAIAGLQSAITAGEDDWPSALAGIAHLNCAAAHVLIAKGRRRYLELLAARAHLREAAGRLGDAAIEGEWLAPGAEDDAQAALACLEEMLAELEGPPPPTDGELLGGIAPVQASGLQGDDPDHTATDDASAAHWRETARCLVRIAEGSSSGQARSLAAESAGPHETGPRSNGRSEDEATGAVEAPYVVLAGRLEHRAMPDRGGDD
ncbi:MAG: hypothetical protein GC150_02595 [Rhizobiales bacterium]|nr:hypothetical protein [Hyphomicrobiales bacterium]